MEEKKVPALRFRGFDNAWEQHKLSELADIVGGGTPSTAISEYWDGDIDWYAPAEIADQIFVNLSQKKITTEGLNNSSAKMLPVGTVLFTSRAGIGKTAILTKEGCTNQGFQSIIPHKDELDSYFVFSRTDELKRYGETVGAGSTFVEVSGKQMANMTISIPATMGEQRQIGTYFRNLDNLIILHQRKLEMLKKVKKSMLEKMFPKNDAKVPEVRFSDFTDAWEQRRLGELGHTEGGTSIESEFDSEGKYKVISIGSYSEESDYVDQGIRAIESEKTLRRVLQKNDLTMILNDKTSSGKIIGRVLFIDRSDVFVYNQRTEMIRGYEDRYYPKFLYHLLNAPIQRKKIVKQSQGNTQIYVNWSKVSETQYMIPEVGEQTIISNYFSYFDHLISLHQCKLEKLKNIKKSMLEKMFII